ncbi:uncharacterized protein [Venturia canescens]|uniref:uncharacterized protein n=1 Tax=Venturia canescens TaxID=32260 RepID=UPI001C9D0DCE|nr:uncharacterized protein LOC122412798 [Venturia canescens]
MGYSLLILVIFNVTLLPATCRNYRRIRDNNNANLPNSRQDDVNSIRRIFSDDLPRRALVDILQKGQYFQDIFSEHLEPLKIQFGHVCENPHEWEQRFERKDLKNNQHQGKVRWGNKNAEYGEHYWDLNHGQ